MTGVGTLRSIRDRAPARPLATPAPASQEAMALGRGVGVSLTRRAEVLEAALREYVNAFDGALGDPARAYLLDARAIDPAVARDAGVGYLPPRRAGAASLVVRLLASGFTPREIRAADVGRCRDDAEPTAESMYDYPAGGGYLALPTRTPEGTLIGFKYRAVPGQASPAALRVTGTSGSVGAAMFGADRIPVTAREAFVVEGEIDQLSAESARRQDPTIGWTLALHGKELTDARLEHLRSRFLRLKLMLDADEGGWDGILRGGRRLGQGGVAVAIVQMPREQDPNDLLRAGGGAGLASAMHNLPSLSLLEAHARVLVARGIAAHDPVYAARELRITAESLPAGEWLADPTLADRVLTLTDLPRSTFATVSAVSVTAAGRAADVPHTHLAGIGVGATALA